MSDKYIADYLCLRLTGTGCLNPIFRYVKIFFFFIFPILTLFAAEAFSFQVPETLIYTLTLTGVKAGEASLEIKDTSDGIIITSTAKSAKWISVFYTVNNRVESRLSKDMPNQSIRQPLSYKLNLREGRRRSSKEVIFDRNKLKAFYTDYLKNEKREFEIPAFIFDPLSSFYYLRKMNLEVGKPVYVTVFDSKKVWNVEVQVLKKERVKIPAGTFDTIVIKPRMKSEGIFSRKGDMLIWLTDDERKIPVRMKTKIRVGSVIANLSGGIY